MRYFSQYKPMEAEIFRLAANGYRVKFKDGMLTIKGNELFNDCSFSLRPKTSDLEVYNQVILQQEYIGLVNLIKKKGDPSSVKTIVDAGSNIGLTSIFLSKHFPEADIISIEADANNYHNQLKNIAANGVAGQVKVLYNALWKNNNDNLFVSDDFRDGDSWSKSVKADNKNVSSTSQVKAITLQDIAASIKGGGKIDILKIDIEGAEAALFESTEFVECLAKNVRFLALEIHDELCSRTDIYAQLAAIDFSYIEDGETTIAYNQHFIS